MWIQTTGKQIEVMSSFILDKLEQNKPNSLFVVGF